MTSSRVDAAACPEWELDPYEIQMRPSLVYARALQLAHRLCWNSPDLGLQPVKSTNENKKKVVDLRWHPELAVIEGRRRVHELRAWWTKREQVFNVLLDTALHAYVDELRGPLSGLVGSQLGPLVYLDVALGSNVLKALGRPDTVFVDHQSRNLVLLEIKLGDKYDITQHSKYLAFSQRCVEADLFSGYRVFNILLGASQTYLKGTKGLEGIAADVSGSGRVTFKYPKTFELAVAKRFQMTNVPTAPGFIETFPFFYCSWQSLVDHLQPGLLKDNLSELCERAGVTCARS